MTQRHVILVVAMLISILATGQGVAAQQPNALPDRLPCCFLDKEGAPTCNVH